MLQNNLKALYVASSLMQNDASQLESVTQEDIQEAFCAIGSMIDKTQKAQTKFAPGISQHTLLKNRLKALQIAKAYLAAFRDKIA
ncbi:MAG: hypothetical protein KC433_28160 [Anaerolineales bacterium]|nr:hypothetical protein [Anaerolineales bacterium]